MDSVGSWIWEATICVGRIFSPNLVHKKEFQIIRWDQTQHLKMRPPHPHLLHFLETGCVEAAWSGDGRGTAVLLFRLCHHALYCHVPSVPGSPSSL
jgi:hypothetical protein